MKNNYRIDDNVVYITVKRKDEEHEVIIDSEDLEKLSGDFTYQLLPSGYVFRMTSRRLGKRKALYIHRAIMEPSDDLMVDHINGDKLDNRKENLRIVTNAQNLQNRVKTYASYKGAKSKYRGVVWNERDKRWIARVKLNNKGYYLGQYKTEEEAYEVASTFRKKHMPYSEEDK